MEASGAQRPQTEALGAAFRNLEDLALGDLAAALVDSQAGALVAMRKALPDLERAIAAALAVLRAPDSRLIYCGAGTSGRVALLDAVELHPTFNWPNERVHVLLAGGVQSLGEAQEGAEDDAAAAARELAALDVSARDVVIGLAASGTTPFVLQAMATARAAGATTIGIANNPGAPLLEAADCPVLLDTGPEALAGSTRLTAGTSQKICLNTFSTAVMMRLGRVYGGHMVDMRATNAKLRKRARAIVADIAGCDEAAARAALQACDQNVKQAILVLKGATPEAAARLLETASGDLRAAVKALEAGASS
ncbi:N-acetylmuramic acid 6-phosphate etherase [Stappia stellulata]|uniref:N-acetylmuramic acid 6-phosphate etherase n=1 Tax=Stappia stellulata TaxID=71235 RepID=UPI001CD28A21|nr:N-acetylmuramic acid 6-phosphate etherase [Stappia stellulata]MCA1243279.1 N-acetylmuramic acid 6-phosphate etherase [Stappia stellulata]